MLLTSLSHWLETRLSALPACQPASQAAKQPPALLWLPVFGGRKHGKMSRKMRTTAERLNGRHHHFFDVQLQVANQEQRMLDPLIRWERGR